MKTLKEKIEVMQAALDGKEIEVNRDDGEGWRSSFMPQNHAWEWGNYDYRIKPEPMEFHMNVFKSSTLLGNTREAMEEIGKSHADYIKTIKVIEVIE